MRSHRPQSRPASPIAEPGARSGPCTDRSNQAAIDALRGVDTPDREEDDSFLNNLGEGIGMGAGVLVTELLAFVPGWNDELKNEDGSDVQAVEGAERIGEHELEKRHQQVVGPQIAERAAELEPGMWKDFLTGVGEGATDAPGASYRLEAGILEHLSEWWD